MLYIDATRIFLYTMIILTGNSFSLIRLQANASEDATNRNFSLWNCSNYTRTNDQLGQFNRFVNRTLERVEKLETDAVIENKTIFYHPISITDGGYHYTQTNQSFERLRGSSIRFRKIRGRFNTTTEVQLFLTFNSALIIEVNITRPHSTKLVKKLKFTLKRVVFFITTNINQNSNKSHPAPKLIHFDYITSVKNYELVDPEPPTDKLIAEIKALIQSAFIHKFSNETKQNLITEFSKHYPEILRGAYCTSRNRPKTYLMKSFPNINITSSIWKMTRIQINGWLDLKYIKISYRENSIKINLTLGNTSIKLQANCNSSINFQTDCNSKEQLEIDNNYKIDQTQIILTREKEKMNKWRIKFDGFKSINQSTSNLWDDKVKAILAISMENAIWADPDSTINIQI